MSRLSYSFLILAGVLGYETYSVLYGRSPAVPQWKLGIYIVTVLVLLALGLIGLRIRHDELRRGNASQS